MGGKKSKPRGVEDPLAANKTKQLDKQMAQDFQKESVISKLLLLGAGESGKSTLFKQMITIYGKGYTEQERRDYRSAVFKNCIEAMQELARRSEDFTKVSEDNNPTRERFLEVKDDAEVTPEIGSMIKVLWADNGIKMTYEKRSQFQIMDSAAYFFDKIDVISQPDYCPDEQDVLRSRVRTTGIVENNFTIEGNDFRMYDVGGQRSERKKWIHCFENVTAVLFVAAISEYDQLCYEDEKTNRMEEALTLFDSICNSKWFKDTSMILFLNKCDLFANKIRKVPITSFFKDYEGDGSYNDTTNFITKKFLEVNKGNKEIYPHVTCATDTGNVTAVFNAVKDIILKQSLAGSGLV